MPTSIEWTNETWNPLRARRKDGGGRLGWACVRVSQGCVNCYAAKQNASTRAVGGTGLDYTVPALAQVETVMLKAHLEKPAHWRKPRRIFVCSMTDLFGEWVADEQIGEVFDVMARARQHTYQVLTKRPERMRAWITERGERAVGLPKLPGGYGWLSTEPWPLPNVWCGTSVEDQAAADERIPHLLATPAAVRFLSCEPLIGPVDLTRVFFGEWRDGKPWTGVRHNALKFHRTQSGTALDWVIVGGESGPRARPMDLAWARSLVEQCRAAGVAVFVKQLGSKPSIGEEGAGREFHPQLRSRDRRSQAGLSVDSLQRAPVRTTPPREVYLRESHGRNPDEWPEDLRVREWPHG